MSLLRALQQLPSSYAEVRLHHCVVLYVVLFQAGTSAASLTITKKIAGRLLSAASIFSDYLIPLVYAGLVPDCLIRWGIRLRLRDNLQQLSSATTVVSALERKMSIVQELSAMPIAVETVAANEQHYEVPTAFYDLCLGPCKKYSSGLWPTKQTTFAESEIHMLQCYCERAGVIDGMSIVDLGCGWGSLTLYLAQHFPNCQITGISNSHSQREYILKTATARGLNVNNITILTCNVSDDQGVLNVVKDNDLVMTVEMFEHMKNYQQLLEKVHGFLKPTTGRLFVHIFTHKDYAYHFDKGWMSDNFFTGGTMPSDDLLLYFAKDFYVLNHWRVNGTHYEKTSNAWLKTMDSNWKKGVLKPVLAQAYGDGKEREWYVNWRLFFLACAELWGLDHGEEWIVSHYLFQRR